MTLLDVLMSELVGERIVEKAWPKGRKLSSSHRAAISRALRGRGHGGKSKKGGGASTAPAPSPAAPKSKEELNAAKRARAQKRREAAKSGMTAKSPKEAKPQSTTRKPPASSTGALGNNTMVKTPAQVKADAKRARALKRREAAKAELEAKRTGQEAPKVETKAPKPKAGKVDENFSDTGPKADPEIASIRARQAEVSRQLRKATDGSQIRALRTEFDDLHRQEILAKTKSSVQPNAARKNLSIPKGQESNWKVQSELGSVSQMPNALHSALNEAGVKHYLGTSKFTELDSNQRLAGVQPRGWTPGSSWEQVGGGYNYRSGTVTTSVTGNGSSSSGSVALHEYGHAVGDKLKFDDHPTTISAHKQMFDRLSPYLKQEGPGGRAGRQEFFAEAFAHTVSNPGGARRLYGDTIVDMIQKEIMDPYFEIDDGIR